MNIVGLISLNVKKEESTDMMDTVKIKNYLQGVLSPKRYRHSIGVAEEAVRLAKHYSADTEKAYIAGLVHDCAKEIDAEKSICLLKERYKIIPDAISLQMPRLLHGVLGACVAQSEFDIYDPEILDAVRYHTTGKANMSLLSRIIYIADYIEPGREFDGVDELRETAYRDIDGAIIFGIDFTICDLIKHGRIVHPDTVHCRNDLLVRRRQDGKEHAV